MSETTVTFFHKDTGVLAAPSATGNNFVTRRAVGDESGYYELTAGGVQKDVECDTAAPSAPVWVHGEPTAGPATYYHSKIALTEATGIDPSTVKVTATPFNLPFSVSVLPKEGDSQIVQFSIYTWSDS